MPKVSLLKGVGYAISTVSVVLLGTVGWRSASEQPFLFACLLAGMMASIVGMLLRWVSHRTEREEKPGSRKPRRRAPAGDKFFRFEV
jgi:hypothetical protein